MGNNIVTSNNLEEMKEKITEQLLKSAVSATIKGMIAWISSDKVVCQDKTTKQEIPNSEIEMKEKVSIMDCFVSPELEKVGITYIREDDHPVITNPQSEVMTLEECKMQVAINAGFSDIESLVQYSGIIYLYDHAAELYASQFKAKAEQLQGEKQELTEQIQVLLKRNVSQQAELEQVKAVLKEIIPMAKDGYKLHVKNACHQEFLSEDRELLAKAQQALQSTKQQDHDKAQT